MNKEKIKELWHQHTEGDKVDVEHYNRCFNGWGRSATVEDRLIFNEYRLLNLMACLNKIMEEITKDEHPTSIRPTP